VNSVATNSYNDKRILTFTTQVLVDYYLFLHQYYLETDRFQLSKFTVRCIHTSAIYPLTIAYIST